ncbi:MAG: DUF4232 domain-containing protein [Mycobacteriales bacterium]
MRLVRAAAGLACLAALVAGCSAGDGGAGTAAPLPTTEPTTAEPTTAEPAPAAVTPGEVAPTRTPAPAPRPAPHAPTTLGIRCHTADLDLRLGPVDGAAGHLNGTVQLVDASGRRCVIQGYGGLAFLDAGRHALPIGITRDGPAPLPNLLAGRGAVASKPIQWGVIPTGADADPASCPTPTYVAVIPPDETVPLTARWPFGLVCGHQISGKAYGAED